MPQLLSPCSRAQFWQLLTPRATAAETPHTLEPVLCHQRKPSHDEEPVHHSSRSSPHLYAREKPAQQGPSTEESKQILKGDRLFIHIIFPSFPLLFAFCLESESRWLELQQAFWAREEILKMSVIL